MGVITKLEKDKKIFQDFVENFEIAIKSKEIYCDDDRFYEFTKFFYETIYDNIHNYIEQNKNEETENLARTYGEYIKQKLIPTCMHKIRKISQEPDSQNKRIRLNRWMELEDDFFALASYRDLKMFALYIERGNPKKIWRDTMNIFEPFFDYVENMIYTNGKGVSKIRASYFPGAGKTYAMNLFCAFWFGYDTEISILRITYSDNLCKTFIRQIAHIIDTPQFRKVFPKFNVGEQNKVPSKELYSAYSVDDGFQFTFSTVKNFYSAPRGGQITGKRARVLMTDDLLKGAEEAYDFNVQTAIVNKYDTDWNSRADGDTQLEIHGGTMWGEQDLLNVLETRERKNKKFYDDKKYKYTRYTLNKKGIIDNVFIGVPILDYETDTSTCPLRYSTEKLREKRENFQDKALFESVYQQNPQPQEGMIFAYKKLFTYDFDSLPLEIRTNKCEAFAFIDPARKGKNYVAMGIFKRYPISPTQMSKWFLVDCIYKKDLIENLLPKMIDKMVQHNVSMLGYENNTDTNLKLLLKAKLKERGYENFTRIKDFYSYENKETKISRARNGILNEIVYPKEGIYSITSEMGLGMYHLITYNLEKKVDYDDFPDMLSMFVKYYCEKEQGNKIKVLKRNEFRI